MRLALALCLLASPALADDYIAFHSPSGNIQCAIATGDYSFLRCDMRDLTLSFTQGPADCEFDWGNSFAVEETSTKGYLACVSDSVSDSAGMELGYGATVTLGGYTCTSAKSGMTCQNSLGHGFSLSKARQSFF